MKDIWAVTVVKEGQGHSAFVVIDGKPQRLSPTWMRDVHEDRLTEVKVALRERGRFGVTKRLLPVRVGTKLVTGESLAVATRRAEVALKLIAAGQRDRIVFPKESA